MHGPRTALTANGPAAGAGSAASTTAEEAVQERYRIGELIGRGGMAEVYRGVDTRLGRPVAIKRLRTDLSINPLFRSRFGREALAAGRLSHPAIVAVYDTGEQRDAAGTSTPFIVMELVEGRSLREVLREDEKVLPERALELTAGVLDALDCSHHAGVVHRDIKPGNVMLTSSGAVKVADFGIAHAVSDASGTVTLAGTVMGTAQYLSPEQGRGEPVDVRSDVYSVGCLLYELLVGRPPFTGDSPVSIIFQHVSEAPDPPSAARSDVSADIDSITLKAMAKDPADRYQTALEMKADIESVLCGTHPQAATELLAPQTERSPEVKKVRTAVMGRSKLSRMLAVVTSALVVVAAATAFGGYRSAPAQVAVGATVVEVPAVMGLGRVGADSLLRNAHLVPRFQFVHGPDGASVDTVVDQEPNGGDGTAVGSAVLVTINIGRPRAAIPGGLVGLDVDQVMKILREAGFRNVTTTKATPSNAGVPAGQVMSLDPAEGRTARLAQRITVTYAAEASRPLQVTPPSVATSRGSSKDTSSEKSPGRLTRQGDDSAGAGSQQSESPAPKKQPDKSKKGKGDHTDGQVDVRIHIDPKRLLPLNPADDLT
jgi:serine/threonine-protein kinase